ncbi:FcoT family thioesterase [Streptomyces sp. NPDC050161]|uniref:(2E)-enoyl-ACP glycyltransferase n=1 Tax=Streptomyces sp. NPDC050161 TaxID=3365604 RepID=UPI003797428D
MSAISYPTDPEILDKVLQPYKEHCKYLKSADVTAADGVASTRCTFSIPESCYIDDTGHLNSVEVNICYNQMAYYTAAAAVKWGLLEEFSGWTMDDYWKRLLPDMLITRFQARFRRPVDPRAFGGEVVFNRLQRRASRVGDPLLMINTTHRYYDDAGEGCGGEVTLALTRLPD